MIKTILVPIDFTVKSLYTLKLALSEASNTSFRVVLLYGESPSDSITEMLFFRRERLIDRRKTKEFMDALEIIKNRFESKINSIAFELITVDSKVALNHILEDQRIEHIYVPENYKLKLKGNSFDTIPKLLKTDVPVTKISFEQSHSLISDLIQQYQLAFS